MGILTTSSVHLSTLTKHALLSVIVLFPTDAMGGRVVRFLLQMTTLETHVMVLQKDFTFHTFAKKESW